MATTSTSSTTTPFSPTWIGSLVKGSAKGWGDLQTAAWPGMKNQLGANPLQIAGMTPDQLATLQQIINSGTGDFSSALTDINKAGWSPQEQQIVDEMQGRAVPYLGHDLASVQGAFDQATVSPQERDIINQIQKGTFGEGSPDIQSAESLLASLSGGPIGSSPATMAGMRAYESSALPGILSGVAMSGSGRGGAIPAAMMQGEEAAYLPLVQQEIADRMTAAGQYANMFGERERAGLGALGAADLPRQAKLAQGEAYQGLAGERSGINAQTMQNLAEAGRAAAGPRQAALAQGQAYQDLARNQQANQLNAYQAEQLPQQTQQAQFDAAYNDLIRQFGLEQQLTMGPLEQFGLQEFGSTSRGSRTTDPWADLLPNLLLGVGGGAGGGFGQGAGYAFGNRWN